MRRKLKVATCFTALISLIAFTIIINLALTNNLHAWFEFSAIHLENLNDTVKFWFIVASLFQPYDFKVTLLVLSPIYLID